MKRTPLRRRRNPGVPRRVRVDVATRSDGRCEYTFASADHPGDGRCGETATDLHHLLPRSQGGRHTADNLVALCRAHHMHIHRHPTDSYALGWLRRRETA